MSVRKDVSPDTLPIDLLAEGITVDYSDGRQVFYNGVPEKTTGPVHTQPGKDVQILVTDPTETEGILVYVNERNTHHEILETTGVGRIMVESGEQEELFPGVHVDIDGYAVIVDADPEVARGRVFVFEEDEMGERSFEIVSEDADS